MMQNRNAYRRLMVIATLSIFLFASETDLLAENGCPNGYMPAKTPIESMSDCTAIPDYDYGDDAPSEALEPRKPEPLWKTRWGAISVGSTASGGGVGVSTNQTSRRAAEDMAVQQCLEGKGGEICRTKVFSYHNQCAVIAWGEASYVVRSAATAARASTRALAECEEQTDDCIIFYSACSLPIRVR
jgi:hypothetical protein